MADKDIDPKSELNKKQVSDELKDFLKDLRSSVKRDDDSREDWKRKLTIATNQRLGVKRNTNYPYPGAPNIPLPETDKQIRKKKPSFVLAVIGQSKPVRLGQPLFGASVPPEQLRLAEEGFNYLLKNRLDLLRTITKAADNFMEKGFCIFKIIERFNVEEVTKSIDMSRFSKEAIDSFKKAPKDQQELFISEQFNLDLSDEIKTIRDILKQLKSNKKIITYKIDKITSFPEILVRDSERVIFPTYTKDIEHSERVTDEFFMSERELVTKGINGTYDLAKVNKNIDHRKSKRNNRSRSSNRRDDSIIHQQKNYNEGVTDDLSNELYRMHEVCCWRPTGTNGRYERWTITFMDDIADDIDAAVSIRRFLDDEWDYIKHDNEVKDDRPYSSRGVPEQIRALQQFMEKAFNNMLIRDEINNSPIFTVLSTSKIQASQVRFRPGQQIKVTRHDEVAELGNRQHKVDLSSNLIVDKLKAFAEEYLASSDQLFRNATNEGGGKTLGEIRTGIALNQQIQSLDLMLWNETLRKVYKKVWKKLKDGLIEPFTINGVTITRNIFDFEPEIQPTGSIENIDQNNMVQKALMRVQQIMQQVQLGLIATPEDLYNAMNDYLEKDGVKDIERYTTDPKVIQQQRQQQVEAQRQLLAQADAELAKRQANAEARASQQEGREQQSA